ncbi:hypothetical protein D1013_02040 [Euzebyella marina]|uniref:Uncharacterized protein n=1 Tax=Euzebyella marina TaxID=1761453 RepID=A0A3G2L1W7_9FLAO|nr:PQQ-binding-like beta-propeller repeat protein [Euzebyella marina]AYN66250.1 hypothetical protein D1013_02040 [Euzebyella marina]
MRKLPLLLVLAVFFVSCSKDDAPSGNENPKEQHDPDPVVEEEPQIGLQFFGNEKEYDMGVSLHTTSEGFIGFEKINETIDRLENDLAIRKLSPELELIEEIIVEIEGGFDVSQVVSLPDGTFLLVGRRFVMGGSFPVIQNMNDKGEVLKSYLFGGYMEILDLNGRATSVTVTDAALYVTIDFFGNQTTIAAIDYNFEEIWHRTFNSSRNSKGYWSGDSLYFTNTTKEGDSNLHDTLNVFNLGAENGQTLWEQKFENIKADFSANHYINKMMHVGDELLLFGCIGREESASTGQVPQGLFMKLKQEDGEQVERLLFDDYWAVVDAIVVDNDIIIGGYSVRSELAISRVNSDDTMNWDYFYGPRSNENLTSFQMVNGQIVFIGSVQATPENDDRDAVYGILDAETGQLQ